MTDKSGWLRDANELPRVNPNKRRREKRIEEDRDALTAAHQQLEILSHHALNDAFGSQYDSLVNDPDYPAPPLLVFANIGTVRSVLDAVMNASEAFCVHGHNARNVLNNLYDNVPFDGFEMPREKREDIAAYLNEFKADYKNNAGFPTVEADYDYVTVCTAGILDSLISAFEGTNCTHPLHLYFMRGLMGYYADTLQAIEAGMTVGDLIAAPQIDTGIDTIDNAYKTLENILIMQIQALEMQELKQKFNGQSDGVVGIQSGYCHDALSTLQEYRYKGAWPLMAENISEKLLIEINNQYDVSRLDLSDFPDVNEMVVIAEFLLSFREKSIEAYPKLYTGDVLRIVDHTIQQTLYNCDALTKTPNPSSTQSVRMTM